MRAPGLRFALAGAALFVVVDRSPAPAPATRIAADANAGAAGTDDALLFDVALDAAVDRTDPLVRARLANLGRYLSLVPAAADDGAAERAARALGLVHSDPIIRRHLIDLMHLTAKTLPPSALPSEAELRAYYDQHRDDYAPPPRVRLAHVYLNRDRHGARLGEDAGVLALRLRDQGADAGSGLGDPFARGARIGPATEAELTRIFGPTFAAAALALPPRQWSAPIASSYGLHIVWVDERLAGAPPPFETVRGQLLHAWLRQRRADQLAASLSALRGG